MASLPLAAWLHHQGRTAEAEDVALQARVPVGAERLAHVESSGARSMLRQSVRRDMRDGIKAEQKSVPLHSKSRSVPRSARISQAVSPQRFQP